MSWPLFSETMNSPKKPKSPSRIERDTQRMINFNLRKLEEERKLQIIEMTAKIEQLENELKKKESKIFKLEIHISNLKFSSFKPKKKLSIRKTSNQDIPPALPAIECCSLKCYPLEFPVK